MSNRGLSTATITALGSASVEYYYLFKIGFSTPLYYTLCPYDIDFDGNTYTSTGLVIEAPTITESLKIKPSTLSLEMSGASTAMHALTLTENYRNAEVFIYLHEISSKSTTQIHKGFIDDYETKDDPIKGVSSVVWKVANHWTNWEAIEGRFVNDANQQLLFAGDLGLEFANVTPPLMSWWGNANTKIFSSTYNGDPGYAGRLTPEQRGNIYFPAPWWELVQHATERETSLQIRLPVVYGQVTLSGTPVYRAISGTKNQYLWAVYALAEGECEDLVDITFEGVSYTHASISGKLLMVKANNFHSGSDTQTVDATLDADADLPLWTSNHRLRGICYCAIRYEFDKKVWGSGEPTPLFEIKGKKVYDPRTSTTAYSSTPALALYDYLVNTRYGKALTDSDLDAFDTGADYCETTNIDHDAALAGTPASINLFDCNGIVSTNDSIKKNVEKLLFTMRAHLPFVNGQYKLVIEREDDDGDFVIDEDNYNTVFSVSGGSTKDIANHVTFDYIDADLGSATEQVISESASLLAIDNNRVLKKSFTNKFETNRYRAKNRAATILKKSRQQLRVKCTLSNFEALKLEPGVIVKVNSTLRGWSLKAFRAELMAIPTDGRIKLELLEYEPSVYDWNVSVETDPPANTTLLNPFDIVAPTALVLTSGTSALLLNDDGTIISRIKVNFTASVDAFVIGYNVYIKTPADAEKLLYTTINDTVTTELYISPVEDGISYTVSIGAINLHGNESALLVDSETVVGKTAVPADVTNFTVSQNSGVIVLRWKQVSDLDLAGYGIRYAKRNGSSYDDATPLTNVTRGTNVTTADVPPGDLTFYIKAYDTSGNESTTAASYNLVTTSALDIIFQQEQAPTWSGTLTNFVKHWTGVLIPESTGTVASLGFRVFDEFVADPEATCTYEATEIDIGFDDDVRVWGAIESALGPGETVGIADPQLSIDYRLAAGSYDGFENWSIGDVTLRYCKHKLTLDTTEGVAKITGFLPTVDLLEHTVSAENVTIAAGGTTITFAEPFHTAPFVRTFILGTTGLSVSRSNITAISFKANVFSGVTDVGGSIDWEATGV